MKIYTKILLCCSFIFLLPTISTDAQRPELVVQTGHSQKVNAIAFSPDGQLLASASDDLTVKLWHVQNGKELRTFPGWYAAKAVAFSPTGKLLATGHTGQIILWDVETGSKFGGLQFSGSVEALAFRPDGWLLAAGSSKGLITFWDIETGSVRHTPKASGSIHSITFSPDGKIIAGCHSKTVTLWDVETGQELRTFSGHSKPVKSVAFSPDGQLLASGGDDNTIALWDVATGEQLSTLTGHAKAVNSVAFSPDGHILVSGSSDGSVGLWDVRTGKELRSLSNVPRLPEMAATPISSVAFNPDGSLIAGASFDKVIFWDAHRGEELRYWDTHSGPRTLGAISALVKTLVFSPDGVILATRSSDTISLWNLQTGEVKGMIGSHNWRGDALAFSPDNQVIAYAERNSVKFWDMQADHSFRTLTGHEWLVNTIAFSPDGSIMASGGAGDNTIKFWDVQTDEIIRTLTGHAENVNAIDFSPDGRFLVSGSADKTVKLWDVQTGKELHTFTGHTHWVMSAAFSPDGQVVASAGGWDMSVRLWDVATGKELHALSGHRGPVNAVIFSPDGSLAVSGSDDKTVKLWNVQTGKELRTLTGHTMGVSSLALSPDGRILASGSQDTRIMLWDVESGKKIATLVMFEREDFVMSGGKSEDVMLAKMEWSVSTPDGQFDASPRAMQEIHGVIGTDVLELAQFQEHYHEPDLLRKCLGLSDEPFRKVTPLAEASRFPGLDIMDAVPHDPKLRLQLTDQGGGIGRVAVLLNDEEILADARPDPIDREAHELEIELDVSRYPGFQWGKDNTVSVKAYNAAGSLFNWQTYQAAAIVAVPQKPELVLQHERLREQELLRSVSGLAMSPDGRILAVDSKEIMLWDLQTGNVRQILSGSYPAFSPDGAMVAVSESKIVTLWEVSTGKKLRTLKDHSQLVSSLAFSPNGRLLATASHDATVKLWDVQTGEVLHTLTGHPKAVNSVAFSPDGQRIASGGAGSIIHVWDVQTGNLRLTLSDHTSSVFWLTFSPDGHILASIGSDEFITLWDVRTGKEPRTLSGHNAWGTKALTFSPDGDRLIDASSEHTLRIWDIQTGTVTSVLAGHTVDINALALSPDGRMLVSGSRDGRLKFWDMQTGEELAAIVFLEHNDWVLPTRNGQFDASPGGMKYLHWNVGPETVHLTQLAEHFYEPGLLSKLLGMNEEPLRDVSDFTVGLYPGMKFLPADPNDPALRLHFRNRGGGIGRISVFINGKEIIADARGSDYDPQAQEVEVEIDLSEYVFLIPGVPYQIEVEASNAAGTLVSQRLSRTYGAAHTSTIANRQKPELLVQTGHAVEIGETGSVAVSPNGRLIASSDNYGIVKLWDARTGKEFRTFQGDGGGQFLTFSPDSRILASCSPFPVNQFREIKLWNVYSGEEYRTFTLYNVSLIAFSPDGRILAGRGGMGSGVVAFWDVRTGQIIRQFRDCSLMGGIAFSPDGETFAIANVSQLEKEKFSYRGSITLWNVKFGSKIQTFTGHSNAIPSLAFSPDSTILASGSYDNTVKLWDIGTGNELHTLAGHDSSVMSITFSPDGSLLASGGGLLDNHIKVWDVHTGQELHTLPGHSAGSGQQSSSPFVSTLTFSPDGKLLVSGGSDNKINVREVSTGRKIRTLTGHAVGVVSVFLTPEQQVVTHHSPAFRGIELSVNNRAYHKGSSVKLWDIRTGTKLHSLTGDSWFISSAALSQDGRLLAIGGWTQTGKYGLIEIRDTRSNTKVCTLISTCQFITSLAFSPDGKKLANGTYAPFGEKGTIEIWEVPAAPHQNEVSFEPVEEPLREPQQRLTEYGNQIGAVAFSPDGRFLAGGSDGRFLAGGSVKRYSGLELPTITIWDSHTGQELHRLQGDFRDILSLVFSPDSKTLAGYCADTITLWDVHAGRKLRSIKGYLSRFSIYEKAPVVFSPDGKMLAGGSDDKTIKLWDVSTGAELRTFTGHTDEVFSVSFSQDGNILVSGSLDGSFKLWDVRSGRELASYVAIEPEDYVVTTPDGYYTASKGGLQGVAFRIGNNVFPFEQFDLKFNRPDIALQRVGNAPQELINAYYSAYQKRLKKMNFNEEMLGDDFHLPETKLLDDDLPLFTTEKNLTFKVNASDSKYLLDRLNVFVNDVPVYGMAGINLRDKNTSEHEQEIALELNNGSNKIQVLALNQKGAESLKETFEIEYTGTPDTPELYVVAVGVSEYADTQFNLNYAAKDATDMVTFFQEHSQNFGKVHVRQILNADAAKEQILAVKDLLKQSQVDDHVVLFFSGHGLLDEKLDYYFATTDIDFRHPAARGLPYEAIEGLLDGIPARKKLLFMDTCHSGEVDKEAVGVQGDTRGKEEAVTGKGGVEKGVVRSRSFRGFEWLPEDRLGLQHSFELLRELFADLRRGSGAMVISSASGREFAFESRTWGNGVFTYALLEGLQGNADLNKDQEIRVSELRDYAMTRVQELTNNRQTPTARRENLEFDFRVY